MVVWLVEDSRYLDRDGRSADPPMTEYEREVLGDLRRVFDRPYLVKKIPHGPNETGLDWNPDFWVEKNGKVILVISALGPDTTLENLDARMMNAYATMVLNWEVARHGGTLPARRRAVIVPDKVLEELGRERYQKYVYAFDAFDCEVIPRNHIAELELHRDEEDREKQQVSW